MTVQQPNFAKTRDQIARVQDELSDQLAELTRTDELFTTFQWNTLAKVGAYQIERQYTVGVEVTGAYTELEMEAAVGPVDSRFFADGEQKEPAGYRDLASEAPYTGDYEKDLLDQEYYNITHSGGESARQIIIGKEVACLDTVISAMAVHNGTEATALNAAIQARADALASNPDPGRLAQITSRIAFIMPRGADIAFTGSVTDEYYEESDSWLSARLSRERGSLQQIYYAGQNEQLWNRVSGKVGYDGAAESEVGEYLFLLDEQNILLDEITEIDTDPDSLGTTPIRTGSVLRLLISYQNQQTTLGQELTMGDRLHADERANVTTEKGVIDGLLISTQTRLTHLSQFYKPLAIRQDQEIRKLFDKNLTTLTDGFLLSIVSPTTVTIVNAYDGMVDLSVESAARVPVKDALEAELKVLYDVLADATTEAQRVAIEHNIRLKEAEILAVSRVTIIYKYVDNPVVFSESLLPDINGNVVVGAAPLVDVMEPPTGRIGDPKLGVVNISEPPGGAVTVQYAANMATLYGTMTAPEKVSRHAAIMVRQGQVTTRLTQLNTVFARRNFPTPALPPYQGPQGSQGVQGQKQSVVNLYRDGPQGLAGYQGPQGEFIGVQGWQGNQGYQGTNPGPQGGVGPQGVGGSTGPAGPDGPAGAAGVPGVQGYQGVSGYGGQGAQGNQGPGNAGTQGWQGNQGYQGVNPGPQGDPGAQGRQGSQGTGAQGVQGYQGNQGRQGTQGWQGSGVQGWQGDNPGSQGPQGVQGVQGDQGFRGDQGPRGYQGRQGWQGGGQQGSQGWQGTGVQGYQGNQGRQGWQGAGAQGYQGWQGRQGFQGNQGWQGPQGWQGTGVQGAQGNQGNQGAQGWQGTGAQGWQGDNPGSQGSQGPQGPQGWQGLTGSQGPQGWQGKDGTQGFQGFQGNGVQGAQGWQGFQGLEGVQGNQGWQGSGIQGWQGDLGSQGWQGENPGPQGDPGNQGSQGVQGWQGTGADGAQGVQGVQGWQGGGTGVDVQVFTTPGAGTWVKPAACNVVQVFALGGGGGGAGGTGAAASAADFGGGGGAGGSYVEAVFDGHLFPGNQGVSVGDGGAGGAGGTGAQGSNGTAGGNTTFGSAPWLKAGGGGAGLGGNKGSGVASQYGLRNQTGGSGADSPGFVETLTGYTEVDAGAKLAETATRVTATALTGAEDSYLYKDKGVGYFSANFKHRVDVNMTVNPGYVYLTVWEMANTLDDTYWQYLNGPALFVDFYRSGVNPPLIQMYEAYSGSAYVSASYVITLGVTYYLEIERDESVGTYGTLYCRVYSDSARTTLLTTLSLTLHAKIDFRYMIPMSSWNTGSGAAVSGYAENLNLAVSTGVGSAPTDPSYFSAGGGAAGAPCGATTTYDGTAGGAGCISPPTPAILAGGSGGVYGGASPTSGAAAAANTVLGGGGGGGGASGKHDGNAAQAGAAGGNYGGGGGGGGASEGGTGGAGGAGAPGILVVVTS